MMLTVRKVLPAAKLINDRFHVQQLMSDPRPGGRFYVKKTYNLFALLVKIVQYAPGLTLTEPKVILFFEKTQSTGCLDNVFLI